MESYTVALDRVIVSLETFLHVHLCLSVTLCGADVVHAVGVLLDSELSMQRHISEVVSACFYHLRRLRQIRNGVTTQLVISLVFSRLNYCSSVFSGVTCILAGASTTSCTERGCSISA